MPARRKQNREFSLSRSFAPPPDPYGHNFSFRALLSGYGERFRCRNCASLRLVRPTLNQTLTCHGTDPEPMSRVSKEARARYLSHIVGASTSPSPGFDKHSMGQELIILFLTFCEAPHTMKKPLISPRKASCQTTSKVVLGTQLSPTFWALEIGTLTTSCFIKVGIYFIVITHSYLVKTLRLICQ